MVHVLLVRSQFFIVSYQLVSPITLGIQDDPLWYSELTQQCGWVELEAVGSNFPASHEMLHLSSCIGDGWVGALQ